jgi:hypothetical protein
MTKKNQNHIYLFPDEFYSKLEQKILVKILLLITVLEYRDSQMRSSKHDRDLKQMKKHNNLCPRG